MSLCFLFALLSVGIYLYAGWVISEMGFELMEDEPAFLWDLHKEISNPFPLATTKVGVRIITILIWPSLGLDYIRERAKKED